MSEWEKVEAVPKPRGARHTITLEPGEIVRPVEPHNVGLASGYNSNFRRQGRRDYHAAIRRIDGQFFLYLWRDPVAAKGEN